VNAPVILGPIFSESERRHLRNRTSAVLSVYLAAIGKNQVTLEVLGLVGQELEVVKLALEVDELLKKS
jgi:hypothetical protein